MDTAAARASRSAELVPRVWLIAAIAILWMGTMLLAILSL
jgi:hypothetical protein